MTAAARVQAAAALATLLTAATLATVVQGVWWYLEVCLVVLAVSAAGVAARRLTRAPAVAVVAQAATLLVVLTWLYARDQAVLGLLPWVDSTTRLLEVGAGGLQVTQQVAAPAPAEPGVRLLAAAGLGAVAVVVDLVAVGLRRPAVAGLPLLAVYCVPAALARGGLDWYLFVLAGAGYLLLVASDAGERVSRWGRVLHGQGGDAAPLAATGRRVGALALAGAVVVPTLVPGLSEGLFFARGTGDGPGDGSRIEVVNPIYNLRDDLSANQNLPVLEYETTGKPQPLRIVTVDTFDGTTWEPTFGTVPRSNTAAGGLPTPPGLSPDVATTEERYRIRIGNLGQGWLPVPYPPTRVDILGPWLYDDTLNIIGDGVTTKEGLSYDVRYLEVTPTPQQLMQAPPPARDVIEAWGTAPADLPPPVKDLALEVAGLGSDYERAVRLQQYFRGEGGFRYTATAPEATSENAIADFLERRTGYCVHFASAMAMMARSLGIPARVAVGFLPGSRNEDGSYTVSLRDAHAWPEVFFSGIGWVRFEPTPPTRTGGLPSWATPPPSLPSTELPADRPPAAVPLQPDAGAQVEQEAVVEEGTSLADVLAAVPWRAVAAVAFVLALAAAPAAAAGLVRRRRWRRAIGAGGGATAEAAWTTLAERVRDLGLPFPASATPRQVEAQLGPTMPARGRLALARLARAVEQARYAPAPPAGGPGAGSDVRAVAEELAAVVGRRAHWQASLVPASGLEHLRSSLVDAALAADRAERRVVSRVSGQVRRVVGRRLRAG